MPFDSLVQVDSSSFFQKWAAEIPDESKANQIKHKAIKHFYVSPNRIEVEADIRIDDSRPVKGFSNLRPDGEAFYIRHVSELSKKWNGDPPDDVATKDDNGRVQLSADKVIRKLMNGFTITVDERLNDEERDELHDYQA